MRGRTVGPEVIEAMARAGMAGLEVDHRDHTPKAKERLRSLARDLGLVTTGSSDYHGSGKPNLLGENLTAPEVLEFIEAEGTRSEEHTSELQSRGHLVCRLLLEK